MSLAPGTYRGSNLRKGDDHDHEDYRRCPPGCVSSHEYGRSWDRRRSAVDRREVLGRTFSQAVLTHPYPTVTADNDTVVCCNGSLRVHSPITERESPVLSLKAGCLSVRQGGAIFPPRTARLSSETSAACPHHTAYGTRLSGQLCPTLDFDSLRKRRRYGAAPGRRPRERVMDERSPRSPG